MIYLGKNAAPTVIKKQTQSIWRGNGQTDIVQLSKQNLYRDIVLRLTAAPTLTAGNNTVANTLLGDEWGVITRIRLVANSSDVLFDASGNDLWWINRAMIGVIPAITPTVGDGVTANVPIDSSLILPVWAYRAAKPMEAAYDAGRVTDFRIEITYGTYTNINSAATAWTTQPSVEITSSETEPNGYVPPFVGRIYKRTDDITAASTQFRIPLDVGPFYRAMLINVQATNGLSDLSTALSNVKLVSGSTVHRDLSAAALLRYGDLRDQNDAGIQFGNTGTNYNAGIPLQTRLRVSTTNDPRAWYSLNLCQDGYLTEAIASPTYNDFYLELQTSAACRVNTIAFQLFNNRFAPAQQNGGK